MLLAQSTLTISSILLTGKRNFSLANTLNELRLSAAVDTTLDNVGLFNTNKVTHAAANDTLDSVNEIDFEGLVNDVVNLTEGAIGESKEETGGAEAIGKDGAEGAITSAAFTAVLLLLY